MSIYEVHVSPNNEADLPSAETLTRVFETREEALLYGRSLCLNTSFTDSEIIIESIRSRFLYEYESI